MIRSVFYCSDNGKKEEFVKKTDHEKDKAKAVIAERKSTKDKIVEILKSLKMNPMENFEPMRASLIGARNKCISDAISKIEEEVK